VRHGRIFEARTRFVRTSDEPGFAGFESEEELVEVGPAHYADALLDGVLGAYARDYPEASVLMPIAGIRCIDALQALSRGRILVLALDKGITCRASIEGWFEQPFVAHEGVFSYLVNFDAMRRWFEAKGGSALCSTQDDRSLVAFAGMLPGPAAASGHLRRHFVDQIDSVDAFNAFNSFAHGIHELPKLTKATGVAPLFDLLARMQADPDAFAAIMYRTIDVIAKAEPGVRRLALRLAQAAKENFYSPRFHNDVYYWSGRLHYALRNIGAAERDFETHRSRPNRQAQPSPRDLLSASSPSGLASPRRRAITTRGIAALDARNARPRERHSAVRWGKLTATRNKLRARRFR
jgi:hypothetical protein